MWADRRMKLSHALGAFLLLSCAAPAYGQSYPGEEVTVNPTALGRGYLLYPGGQYGRNVGNLLQPGTRRGDWGVIHLHMPPKHPRVARAPRPAPVAPLAAAPTTTPAPTPDTTVAVAPPPPAPPKPHKPKPTPTRVAAATPPPAATPPATTTPAPTAGIDALPEDSASRLLGGLSGPAPAPAKPAKPPVKPPTRTASATPPPANTTPPPSLDAGLAMQASVPFAAGASSPDSTNINAVHALAASLKSSLGSATSRVQLQAFGGPKGDKGSDSRRLSLKRALVIRELLIEDGVPSEKIDVRAMGGIDDNGAPDRVDVYLRA